jgi:hypothetical protein
MRRSCFVFAAMFVTCAAGAVSAQTDPLSPLQIAVACAPPPSNDGPPPEALRIIGAQDSVPRDLFSSRDLLVIDGGTNAGVELGHEFFIRRTITFGNKVPRGAKTLGWVRVVAVNDSTAIAIVNHACGGIGIGDYLEPFEAPVVSADFEKDEAPGQPDFSNLGHVVAGSEDRMAVGAGDFVLIDWGQAQGLTVGSRVAIYRDLGVNGLPLASIGEGVVVSTSSTMALTRLTRTRDAVYGGDFIAVRK